VKDDIIKRTERHLIVVTSRTGAAVVNVPFQEQAMRESGVIRVFVNCIMPVSLNAWFGRFLGELEKVSNN
jgi:hypothetical protein